jgi:hypothetical protein
MDPFLDLFVLLRLKNIKKKKLLLRLRRLPESLKLVKSMFKTF